MRKILNHIRGQSEQNRRHILHLMTAGAGVILVLLWIVSLGTNFSNPGTQNRIKADAKPLSALKANLIGGYDSMVQ